MDFDFGVEGPDPERFEPDRFAIRWTGSIAPPETGTYEFVVRTGHSARLALNTAWYEPPLIDALVKSGDGTEHRASVFLLGGRSYPLRLEFSKAYQGVDKDRCGPPVSSSISLLRKPPQGVHDKVQGDGDRHMRGMRCLLTGIEFFPSNVQGGSDTPTGWSSGRSIDHEIKAHLQGRPETATRFGSLEFGVLVPNRADTWTRMVYAGPNNPVAPIDDPYQMFHRLYGQ